MNIVIDLDACSHIILSHVQEHLGLEIFSYGKLFLPEVLMVDYVSQDKYFLK